MSGLGLSVNGLLIEYGVRLLIPHQSNADETHISTYLRMHLPLPNLSVPLRSCQP